MSDDQTKRPTEDDEQPTGCTPEMLEWATALLEKERRRRDELLKGWATYSARCSIAMSRKASKMAQCGGAMLP